jgi:large exoprotein involved in heme utilization and adhesion
VARAKSKGTPALPTASSSSPLVQIVEAQGWVKNPDGSVILVAEAPTATPQSPRLNPASCESVSNSTGTLRASPH